MVAGLVRLRLSGGRLATERRTHSLRARLPVQLDALLPVDRTRALVSLERTATWERGEAPEACPRGI